LAPTLSCGVAERQAGYSAEPGAVVDVFVAVYGLGTSSGAEMISFKNVIAAEERKSLARDVLRKLTLADGSSWSSVNWSLTMAVAGDWSGTGCDWESSGG